ncbi:MAG TPA: N-acetylmuramoyl-L-alanine amidase [Bacteroidales bacterium]|nr:N-acetylmuramoyl-L-alanine amidase [Bacteroidales bacterium]
MYYSRGFLASLILAAFVPVMVHPQEKTSLTRIVIDAGHGGKDPGTIGSQVQEKKITLAIALKLGKMIQDNLKGAEVIYTRSRDEFVELHERAEIANRNHADLFISIHCNANGSHSFHGAETYVMGLHRSEANLEIAKLENASILMEPDYSAKYQGFDPNSDESYIIFTLYQNAYLDQSTELAATIQDELKDRVGLNDRGVRQAGFLVLYKTTMPSVLVETGFLSNPEEEKFLMSEKGQDFIAGAIYRAVLRFGKTLGQAQEKTGVPETVAVRKQTPPPPETIRKEVPHPVKKAPAVAFRVQVATSPTDIGIHNARFAGLEDVRVYRHQGLYKYTTGDETTLDDALKLLERVKKKGFRDAFVVAFVGETRVTVTEAQKALGK